jgi:hypothetical protein
VTPSPVVSIDRPVTLPSPAAPDARRLKFVVDGVVGSTFEKTRYHVPRIFSHDDHVKGVALDSA